MLGNYVLHYPLTDFAVGLLVIAAMLDLGRIVLKRPQWQIAVDLLLLLGFAGAVVSVGSGLWLVDAQDHGHSDALSIHHLFAYSTLGVSAAGVVAHLLARRNPKLAAIKTVSLLISAALVSAAGFFGGRMAHPSAEAKPHSHDSAPSDLTPTGKPTETKPHPHDGTNDSHALPGGSGAKPAETKSTESKPHSHDDAKPNETKPAETKPHSHDGTTNDSHPADSGKKPPNTETANPPAKPDPPKPAETKPAEHDHKH